MQEVARCNTIEIGEAVVRAGLKNRGLRPDRADVDMARSATATGKRFLVKSFDIAAD